MTAGDLFQLFGGAGAGVVGVCITIAVLFISGKVSTEKQLDQADERYEAMKEERDEWKKAYELERARSESAVATGQIVRDVMSSLKKELQ